jgi:hypothetical protein
MSGQKAAIFALPAGAGLGRHYLALKPILRTEPAPTARGPSADCA